MGSQCKKLNGLTTCSEMSVMKEKIQREGANAGELTSADHSKNKIHSKDHKKSSHHDRTDLKKVISGRTLRKANSAPVQKKSQASKSTTIPFGPSFEEFRAETEIQKILRGHPTKNLKTNLEFHKNNLAVAGELKVAARTFEKEFPKVSEMILKRSEIVAGQADYQLRLADVNHERGIEKLLSAYGPLPAPMAEIPASSHQRATLP